MKRITGKLILLVAALVLTIAFFVVPAYADNSTVVTGSCGDHITYQLDTDTGVLTLTGYGAMYDGRIWSGYENVITELVMDDRITDIGDNNFYGMSGLTSLTLPLELETIGESAFEDCTGVAGDLCLPEGLQTIGMNAFRNFGCSNTGALTLPEGLDTNCLNSGLRAYAFYHHNFTKVYNRISGYNPQVLPSLQAGRPICLYINIDSISTSQKGQLTSDLKYILWSDGLLGIYGTGNLPNGPQGSYSYGNGPSNYGNAKQNASALFMSRGITAIGDRAFYLHRNLTGSLVIPDTVLTIGYEAFGGCNFSGELVIPNGVTSIGYRAFYDTSDFTGDLILPEGLTSLGYAAFKRSTGFTGTLEIPGSLPCIEDNTFELCNFRTLILPENFTPQAGITVAIGEGAFKSCAGIAGTLQIPNNVTCIGKDAFKGCKYIVGNLYIPASVTDIYDNPFSYTQIENITVDPANPVYTAVGNCVLKDFMGHSDCLVVFGSRLNQIPDDGSILYIGPHAFEGMYYYQNFEIPGNTVYLPYGLLQIGEYAFANGQYMIQPLEIPTSVNRIGPYAFSKCKLTKLIGFTHTYVPYSDSRSAAHDYDGLIIGERAFSDCCFSSGTDLTIPNGVVGICDYAFANNGFTGTMTLPASLEEYTGLEYRDVFTNNGAQNSGEKIITRSPGLGRNIFRADTCVSCGARPSRFTKVYNFGSAKFVPAQQGLSSPETTIVYSQNPVPAFRPSSDTEVKKTCGANYVDGQGHTISWCLWEDGTMYVYGRGNMANGRILSSGYENVTNLILSEGLTSIGSEAFSDFTRLTSLDIPSSVTSIGRRAFYRCNNIRSELVLPPNIVLIGSEAFRNCSNLTGTVTIDSMQTTEGSMAFYGCTRLTVNRITTGITTGGNGTGSGIGTGLGTNTGLRLYR